mmetsp:Transcript_47396/g.112797  ORF Transcript_47396/g.112797 Transcript_47396/m.112797 type:complete len:547 (-) Transcript_47396:193-1833(-)
MRRGFRRRGCGRALRRLGDLELGGGLGGGTDLVANHVREVLRQTRDLVVVVDDEGGRDVDAHPRGVPVRPRDKALAVEVRARHQNVQVHPGLVGALGGLEGHGRDVLVHAPDEPHVLVLPGVVFAGAQLQPLPHKLRGPVDRTQPGVRVGAVVQAHHVQLEIEAGLVCLAVDFAGVVTLDRVRDLLHRLGAPRALCHDVHVHLENLLVLAGRFALLRRPVDERLVDAALDLPPPLDVREHLESIIRGEARVRRVALIRARVQRHLALVLVRGDDERGRVEVRLVREELGRVPFPAVDAVGGDDVVHLPAHQHDAVLALHLAEFFLQLLVVVELPEVPPADGAGEDLVDGVEELLERLDLGNGRRVREVDGASVDVRPVGASEHRAIGGEVELIALREVVHLKTPCEHPPLGDAVEDVLLGDRVHGREGKRRRRVQTEPGRGDPGGCGERRARGVHRRRDHVVHLPHNQLRVLHGLHAFQLIHDGRFLENGHEEVTSVPRIDVRHPPHHVSEFLRLNFVERVREVRCRRVQHRPRGASENRRGRRTR